MTQIRARHRPIASDLTLKKIRDANKLSPKDVLMNTQLVEIKVNLYLETEREKDSYHRCGSRGKVGASGVMGQGPRMRWNSWSSSKAAKYNLKEQE